MEERPATSRYRDSRCIWCDNAEHVPRNCNELKEALRRDLVYYEGGRLHSMDSHKPLRPNFRNGGMKKELEETVTPQRNYATTVGIRVGEGSGVKGTFWPEIIDAAETSVTDVVRSQADDIRKPTRWEWPVDHTSVDALCQLHEVYIEEKRWCTDDVVGPPKPPKKWNSVEKGKEKGPAFRLA